MSKFLDETGLNYLVGKIKTGGIVSKLANITTASTIDFEPTNGTTDEYTTVIPGAVFVHNTGTSDNDCDITIDTDVTIEFAKGEKHRLSKKIDDAPTNKGGIYARSNGSWINFEGYLDEKINEAPVDGNYYARYNKLWANLYTTNCFSYFYNENREKAFVTIDATKILEIPSADQETGGIMSRSDKQKLDSSMCITDVVSLNTQGIRIASIKYNNEESEENEVILYAPASETGPGNTANLLLNKESVTTETKGLRIKLLYKSSDTNVLDLSYITIPNASSNTNGLLSKNDYLLLHTYITNLDIDNMIVGTWVNPDVNTGGNIGENTGDNSSSEEGGDSNTQS